MGLLDMCLDCGPLSRGVVAPISWTFERLPSDQMDGDMFVQGALVSGRVAAPLVLTLVRPLNAMDERVTSKGMLENSGVLTPLMITLVLLLNEVDPIVRLKITLTGSRVRASSDVTLVNPPLMLTVVYIHRVLILARVGAPFVLAEDVLPRMTRHVSH